MVRARVRGVSLGLGFEPWYLSASRTFLMGCTTFLSTGFTT